MTEESWNTHINLVKPLVVKGDRLLHRNLLRLVISFMKLLISSTFSKREEFLSGDPVDTHGQTQEYDPR